MAPTTLGLKLLNFRMDTQISIYPMVILSGFIKQDCVQFSYDTQSFINGDSFYY